MPKQKTKNRTRFFEIKFFCVARSFIANAIAAAKRSVLTNPQKSLLIFLAIITIVISIPILTNIKHNQNSNALTPQVNRIFPNIGSPAGGDKVIIEGKNFKEETQIKDFSAYSFHTCVISGLRTYCWGLNDYGQLGDGSNVNKTSPTLVDYSSLEANEYFVKIKTAETNTCALSSLNRIFCWGQGTYGQLGNGSQQHRNIPTLLNTTNLGSGIMFKDFAVGIQQTCGILFDDRLVCWGRNERGQIGNGGNGLIHTIPTVVRSEMLNSGESFNKIYSRGSMVCGITSHNRAFCWGYNGEGKLGVGDAVNRSVPTLVVTNMLSAGDFFSSLMIGGDHTCGLTAQNKAYCWGFGGFGRLGNGTTNSYYVPTAVLQTNLSPGEYFVKADGSSGTVCFLSSLNRFFCSGLNINGEFGNGASITNSSIPVLAAQAASSLSFKDLRAAGFGFCGIEFNSGGLYCWGQNNYGQLGNNSTASSSTPVPISQGAMPPISYGTQVSIDGVALPPSSIKYISSNKLEITMPAHAEGKVNITLTNPDNTTTTITNAYEYHTPKAPTITSISPSSSNLTGGQTATITGTNFNTFKWKQVSAGYHHTCALTSNNQTYCWGQNNYGQLGNNSTANSSTPVPISQGAIPSGVNLIQIAAGSNHTCAIGSNGQTYCWGYNGSGELGNNSTASSSVSVSVSQGTIPSGVILTQISAGSGYTCALGSNNQAYCWGHNGYGHLGNGSVFNSSTPVAISQGAIPSGVNLTQIATGSNHACALASNNQAYCWGWNNYGQLGNNSTLTSTKPVAISQGTIPSNVTLTQISAGYAHACAIASNNQAYCWGWNNYGQLGNNSTTHFSTPVAVSQGAVPSGVNLIQISAGDYYACAIASNNQAYCWGRNDLGQLGNDSTTQSNVPVAISQGAIPSGVSLTQISAGMDYTCALASNNQAYCWGNNNYGQLGNNSTANSLIPTSVHHTFTINLSPDISIPVSIPGHSSDTTLSFTIPAYPTPSLKDVSITNKLANLNSNTLTQAFRYYTKSNPPTNLLISTTTPTNSLTLSWTSPSTGGIDNQPNQGNNYSPITDYQVEYCIADTTNTNQCQDPTNNTPTQANPTNWFTHPHSPIQSTGLTNLSTKITNLNPDQHYLIRIAAINQAGLSTYLTSQAKVPSYVSVSTDAANLSLNTTPLYSNTYTNASLTATVGTNLSTGYVLRLSTVTNNNQLSTAANHHINPTTHTFLNPGALQPNTWGYYIPNTTANQQHNTVTLSQFTSQDTNFTNQNQDTNRYCQLPTSQSPQIIAQYNQAVQNKTLQLIIGSNIAQTQASGVYTNTIRLEAVGN